jgi:hemolysin activation/secretion protein
MGNMAKNLRLISMTVLMSAGVSFGDIASAAPLPSTVLPEKATQGFINAPIANPKALPPLPAPKAQPANTLGAEAEKIKFKLTHIILQGNTVYSNAELEALYKDKLNKVISVAELQEITQKITNYYRNNGYILSRAILPPQHVSHGVVHVQVIEGFIEQVHVIGVPKGAQKILQIYGNKIAAQRPLQLKRMEHYLLLANELPGVQVKAVLEPSKTTQAASDLNLVADTKKVSGYLSYDNYGTRYIGPTEVSGGITVNSVLRSGDSSELDYATTTDPKELKFVQLLHNTPLGTNGARLILSGNRGLTRPDFVLRPLKINGDSSTIYAMVQYPILRSRTSNITLDGSFNYIDSRVTQTAQNSTLYADHLRTIRLGGNVDRSDSWHGANSASIHVEDGLSFLGATSEALGNTPGITSRFGGSGHFTKFNLQLSRLQQLGASRYSLYALMKGQYALEPLLASEQFDFGGVQQGLGRGYDAAEIIGDRGLSGSIEFRANVSPEKFFLQAAQLYAFYDIGVIWDIKHVVDQKRKQSASSVGVGTRFFFTNHLSGNLLIAQPITRQVDALKIINDGRQPRVFFSVTASV